MVVLEVMNVHINNNRLAANLSISQQILQIRKTVRLSFL